MKNSSWFPTPISFVFKITLQENLVGKGDQQYMSRLVYQFPWQRLR